MGGPYKNTLHRNCCKKFQIRTRISSLCRLLQDKPKTLIATVDRLRRTDLKVLVYSQVAKKQSRWGGKLHASEAEFHHIMENGKNVEAFSSYRTLNRQHKVNTLSTAVITKYWKQKNKQKFVAKSGSVVTAFSSVRTLTLRDWKQHHILRKKCDMCFCVAHG